MERQTYKLSGLNCGHCVNTVKTALEKIEGVDSVSVDLENQLAEISFESEKTGEKDFKKAVEKEEFGFLGKA